MLVLERMPGWRIVSTSEVLGQLLDVQPKMPTLRFAADEVLLLPVADSDVEELTDRVRTADPHAIITQDSSFMGAWLPNEELDELLQRHCEWEPPPKPAYCQGAVAGNPVKLWMESERSLLLVQAPYSDDFLERIS